MCEIDLGISSDWVLKGQGNANAVFAFSGANTSLVGRVLRVRKILKDSVFDSVHAPVDQLTREIWGTGLADSQDVSQLFAAILGTTNHLLLGERLKVQVQLSKELQTGLNNQLCSISISSSTAAQTAFLSCTACLLPDCTVFLPAQSITCATSDVKQPHSTSFFTSSFTSSSTSSGPAHSCETAQPAMKTPAPVLCIEIKPKWGLLPTSPAIPTKHGVKKHKSRFQLHQRLKLAQGKTKNVSPYDPLDLFSKEPLRMQHALQALLACPQNNLKLFLDGQPVQLSDKASLHQIGVAVHQALLPCPDAINTGNLVELLASLLQEALSRTGVLQKLLSIQALDEHDIEGIYPLYQHVLQQLKASHTDCTGDSAAMLSSPVAAGQQSLDALQPCQAYIHQLLDLGWSEHMQILQNYLLATTAKDCSLMIAIQAVLQPDLQLRKDNSAQLHTHMSPQEILSSPDLTCPLHFKLTIVDLDRKPHAKIDAHHRLDQEIMCCVQQRPI